MRSAIARRSGRAAEAVSELWPLVTWLEARVAAGYAEPEAMSLLARARISLGVALGHLPGRGTVHESADDMFTHLDALAADA